MRRIAAFLLCFVCGVGARALALQSTNLVPPPMPAAQAAAYDRITSRVLAPCCWSQPVQIHQSEAAEKVRAEVIAGLGQGQGEREILDRLAAEYGERILGEPRGARGTIAFVTPFAVLAAGLAGLSHVIFRSEHRTPVISTCAGLLPDLPEADL